MFVNKPRPARFDLRERTEWAPVQSLSDVGHGWRIWSWEEPRLPGEIGWDTNLIANLGPMMRLAVADAAQDEHAVDSAQAARSTHTVRGWLRTTIDPTQALRGAAAELRDPTLVPRQRNPWAATAVVDIHRHTGHATAVRVGDSEVWVKTNNQWEPVFPDNLLTAADPNTPPADHPVEPKLEHANLGVVEEVIVATDGARLTPDRCAMLAHWLSHDIQIRIEGDATEHLSPHDDIAALWASRPPRPDRPEDHQN